MLLGSIVRDALGSVMRVIGPVFLVLSYLFGSVYCSGALTASFPPPLCGLFVQCTGWTGFYELHGGGLGRVRVGLGLGVVVISAG